MAGATAFMGFMGGALAQTPLALLVALLTWRITFVSVGVYSLAAAVLCYALYETGRKKWAFPPSKHWMTPSQHAGDKTDLRSGMYSRSETAEPGWLSYECRV